MAIQQIQQLEHDGTRLYCPAHPERKLVAGEIRGANGAIEFFTIFCDGGIPVVGGACMNSAQWNTKAERDKYLNALWWQRVVAKFWP